jgi:hypothetical protein
MISENIENILLTAKRVKIGRPRTVNITDMADYQKQYYEKTKNKYKGDFMCPHCNALCSISNKTRHFKRFHPDDLKPKISKTTKKCIF